MKAVGEDTDHGANHSDFKNQDACAKMRNTQLRHYNKRHNFCEQQTVIKKPFKK